MKIKQSNISQFLLVVLILIDPAFEVMMYLMIISYLPFMMHCNPLYRKNRVLILEIQYCCTSAWLWTKSYILMPFPNAILSSLNVLWFLMYVLWMYCAVIYMWCEWLEFSVLWICACILLILDLLDLTWWKQLEPIHERSTQVIRGENFGYSSVVRPLGAVRLLRDGWNREKRTFSGLRWLRDLSDAGRLPLMWLKRAKPMI